MVFTFVCQLPNILSMLKYSGSQEIDFSILFESNKSEEPPLISTRIGMDSIAFSMAESGTFGNIKK
jgi:hypothetical protein